MFYNNCSLAIKDAYILFTDFIDNYLDTKYI